MKKHIIAFGLAVSLLSFLTVSAAEFPSSGIDEDASTVTIELENQPTGAGTFNCDAGQLNTEITFTDAGAEDDGNGNLIFKNLSDSSATPPINCFGAAGDYTLNIHLVDKAGNEDNSSESFTILPGTPVPPCENCNGNDNEDVYEEDVPNPISSSSESVYADGVSTNTFTLTLEDAYGNEIALTGSGPGVQTPSVYSPTSNPFIFDNYGQFKNDANTEYFKFREGLFIKTLGSYNTIPDKKESAITLTDAEFVLKANAPSIIKENIGNGNFLARQAGQVVKFIFTNLKEVNPDGSFGDNLPPISVKKRIKFLAPFYAKPSIENLSIGEVATLKVTTNAEGASGLSSIKDGAVSLASTSMSGKFCDETLDDNNLPTGCSNSINIPSMPGFNASSAAATNTPIFSTIKKLYNKSNTSVISSSAISLITNLSYLLNGYSIGYPAGAVGSDFDNIANDEEIIGLNAEGVDVKFIGADIEGFTAVDDVKSILGKSGSQILNIGLNSAKTDVYEEIVKNGFALARNSANFQTTNTNNSGLTALFGSDNVKVVDLTEKSGANTVLSISGQLPTGKRTLVLINGNLKITDNLYYNSATKEDDSFGVIVLRTTAGKEPEVGNIFVASNVSKIAGSYFADGGFMNSDKNNKNNPHTKQLLLEGSLLSRNTLGGSLRQANYYTPWGITNDSALSQRYDLHFVRRYDPTAGHSAVSPDPGNTAAFIIRPDQKATILPPPGFKIQ